MKCVGRILFLIGIWCLGLGGPAAAQPTLRVAVAPFTITGSGDISYLGVTFNQDLLKAVASQGYEPVSLGEAVQGEDLAALKKRAEALEADYVLVGSLTRDSSRLRAQARLEPVAPGGRVAAPVALQADQAENISVMAERVVIQATDHLYGSGPRLAVVEVQGNSRVDTQAVLNTIRMRPGGIYNQERAALDLRRIYAMGYFEDVQVETFAARGGTGVRFVVRERPPISSIAFKGNKKFKDDELLKNLGFDRFAMVNDAKINESVENLKKLYAGKGFSNVEITAATAVSEDGNVTLAYNIDEGGKAYIRQINFEGNEHYSARKLRGVIGTSTKGLFSWMTGSGVLNRDKMNQDVEKIVSFYMNNGFIKIQAGEPRIAVVDGGGYQITFPLIEGPQYTVGSVALGGDLADQDPNSLMKNMRLKPGQLYSRDDIQNDINDLKSAFADLGYAQNSVNPQLRENPDEQTVDVEYVITPNQLVYFDRITIVGNNKTRDKVIRRQLEMKEGDLFSATALKNSQNNLMRTGYFEGINIIPGPGDTDDTVNLRLEAKEKPTGAFQIGAGYSSYNSVFGMVKLSQDNLFGYGRRLSVEANIGSKSNYYNISYTDPWTFDLPLTTGLDLFNYYSDYDEYRKEAVGGAIRAGYPLFERVYGTIRYSWEDVHITDVPPWASLALREMEGYSTDSIFRLTLSRDTRNHYFIPTGGSSNRFSVDYASGFLGGTTRFLRYDASSAWWAPVPLTNEKVSLMVRGRAGYVDEIKKGGLPIYQKYEIGGINTVRGYDWYSISPRDKATGDKIGGEKMGLVNLEMVFPIWADSGLYGVGFFDAGGVWRKGQSIDQGWRKSYGGGFRYLSPLGPLRVEYGRALDRKEGDPSGRWEFTVGGVF